MIDSAKNRRSGVKSKPLISERFVVNVDLVISFYVYARFKQSALFMATRGRHHPDMRTSVARASRARDNDKPKELIRCKIGPLIYTGSAEIIMFFRLSTV